jgi:hypothetical protein
MEDMFSAEILEEFSQQIEAFRRKYLVRVLALLSGTPDDVRAYCKKLIDDVCKGGSFIVDAAVMLDGAKPENLKAMIDFTKEYGVYA